MYKTFKKLRFTILLCVVTGGLATAQSTFNTALVNQTGGIEESAANKDMGSGTRVAPSPEILARFNSGYPAASNAVWYCTEQFSYVSFLNAGHRVNISFAPDGKPNYFIAECEMNQLPKDFQKAINRNYKDAHVGNMKRIDAYGKTAFWVLLEKPDDFIVLKYTNDGIEELQHVKKVK